MLLKVSQMFLGSDEVCCQMLISQILVPLMMAYITRYIFGTDKLRPNAFEVRGMNGANTGVIHSNDLAVLSNWIKLISDNINILTTKKVTFFMR